MSTEHERLPGLHALVATLVVCGALVALLVSGVLRDRESKR